MTTAYTGKGVQFKRGDGATPEVFTKVAQVKDLTGPSFNRETIDITNLDSTSHREFIGGLRDGGECSFDLVFDPSNETHKKLFDTDLNSDNTVNYQVVWPEGTKWQFAGLVTGFELQSVIDDALKASVTIKISGSTIFNA